MLSGSAAMASWKCSIDSSNRPSCISTTPMLLCAAAVPPESTSARVDHLERLVEVAEHPLVVAENGPDRVVVDAAEVDRAPQRDLRAVQAAEVVQDLAEHAVVRAEAGFEHHRAAHRGRGLVVALEILQRLSEVVPRLPLAGRDRDQRAQDLLRGPRADPRAAARSRSCCRSRSVSSAGGPTCAAAASNRSIAPSMSLRSARIAPSNCVARSSCGWVSRTRR